MLFPLIVAFVAVGLGAWLALGPRDGAASMRVIRLAAIVASVLVILTHLLPEAVHDLGIRAAGGFVVGLALPTVLEKLGGAVGKRAGSPRSGAVAALEIAYAGLAVHRFGDGLSMGAYSRETHGAWGQAGVVLALALHIVPVTTVMLLAVVAVHGRRSAIFRAAWLAVSTMAGVVVAGVAVRGGPRELSPWISAVVGGLLLHIVLHDVPHGHAEPERLPRP